MRLIQTFEANSLYELADSAKQNDWGFSPSSQSNDCAKFPATYHVTKTRVTGREDSVLLVTGCGKNTVDGVKGEDCYHC